MRQALLHPGHAVSERVALDKCPRWVELPGDGPPAVAESGRAASNATLLNGLLRG